MAFKKALEVERKGNSLYQEKVQKLTSQCILMVNIQVVGCTTTYCSLCIFHAYSLDSCWHLTIMHVRTRRASYSTRKSKRIQFWKMFSTMRKISALDCTLTVCIKSLSVADPERGRAPPLQGKISYFYNIFKIYLRESFDCLGTKLTEVLFYKKKKKNSSIFYFFILSKKKSLLKTYFS